MKYIIHDINDPYFNMAVEEYIIENFDSKYDYFILWQNTPSVLIGKNQNTLAEVNMDYVKKNDIKIVRRLSGGGAIYEDMGNVNFTYIVDYRKEYVNSMKRFAGAIIKALKMIGIEAEFSGRNDILVDGKKISGNAQYVTKDRILHHGTLLFNSDLSVMPKVLNVKPSKISSKGIKSVRSRVTNIKDHLNNKDMTLDQFKELIIRNISDVENKPIREYKFTKQDLDTIKRLRDEKYSTWEWNFGKSPKFSIQNSQRFDGGELGVSLDVRKGTIKNIEFFGDFMSMKDIKDIEDSLKGIQYRKRDIKQVLSRYDLREYFGQIKLDDILEVLL